MHHNGCVGTISLIFLIVFLLNAGDSDATITATTGCQNKFYTDKSQNDGLSSQCPHVLSPGSITLAECIEMACQHNANVINFRTSENCFIKRCADIHDLHYSAYHGGYNIYVLPKQCELAGPLNSDFSGQNLVGYYLDQLTVTCNTGHVIEGVGGDLTSYQTVCQDSGLWTGTKNCERIKCQQMKPNFTDIGGNASTIVMDGFYQVELTMNCSLGFVVRGTQENTSYTTVCGPEGHWTRKDDSEPISCIDKAFENTTMEHDAIGQYPGNITFNCITGYWTKEGHLQSGMAVCGQDGKWIINNCISKSAYFSRVFDDYYVDTEYLDQLDHRDLIIKSTQTVRYIITMPFGCAAECLRVTDCHWFHYKAKQCMVPAWSP